MVQGAVMATTMMTTVGKDDNDDDVGVATAMMTMEVATTMMAMAVYRPPIWIGRSSPLHADRPAENQGLHEG